MQNDKQLIPQLRFPEFDRKWVEENLWAYKNRHIKGRHSTF
jgi:hypothetical protein